MDEIFPELLKNLLVVSVTFSVILMALVQKFKGIAFIKKSWQVWIINLVFSFAVGIPFGMTFYNLNVIECLWVGLFSFIGASGIYEMLKNQNIINYKPVSVDDVIEIPTANEIARDEK